MDASRNYVVKRTAELTDFGARVKQGRYIVIFAPRQTGKTTFFRWALDVLAAEGITYFPIQLYQYHIMRAFQPVINGWEREYFQDNEQDNEILVKPDNMTCQQRKLTMLITQNDIQHIGDEETLLHFLEEKLDLPIPEKATLAQIALPLPLPFLGLDRSIFEHIIDCQDFSGFSQDTLGERRPFLIRFRRESDFSEILRNVAKGLSQKDINPDKIFFICADEHFKPFAFAYFGDSDTEDWYAEVLNIFTWTQGNTRINTGAAHDLSALFSKSEGEDVPYAEEDDPPADQQKETKETSTSEGYNGTQQGHRSEPTSHETLLAKMRKTGRPLSRYGNIHIGITPGHKAFLIDEFTRDQFVNEDPQSIELIKPLLKPRKWEGELGYLICIPSSRNKRWPWTGKDESTAEQIFEETYRAISDHMKIHKDELKNRECFKTESATCYWELPKYSFYPDLKRPKIFYPPITPSMRAAYDDSEKLLTSAAFFTTTDLSLLAILNSKLFAWYTREAFWNEKYKRVQLANRNMNKAPIAPRTEAQKAELSEFVQRILNDSDSFEVADIEAEIDQLVYTLYKLTKAEIALIEEQSNK